MRDEDKQNLISAAASVSSLNSSPSTNNNKRQTEYEVDDDEFFGNLESDSMNPYCDTTTLKDPSNDPQRNNNIKTKDSVEASSASTTVLEPSTNNDPTINFHTSNNNNLRVLNRKRSFTFILGSVPSWTKRFGQIWRFHWRVIISCLLTIISAMGSIILFPIYLKTTTNSFEGESSLLIFDPPNIFSNPENQVNDGYSSCLAITTLCTLAMGCLGLILKGIYYSSGRTILRPLISWISIIKIGFCTGLCILTIFYAWEDHKVLCNLQDPLLGLVFIFAVITHAVSKWREIGFRRSFAIITIGAGIFISVDYTIVDHYKCRGYYYYHPNPIKDLWSWQVHLVWTIAFVVSIWLWTVAMFCMESSLPHLRDKRHHIGEQYNAVKMKVIRIKRTTEQDGESSRSNDNTTRSNTSNNAPQIPQNLSSVATPSRNNSGNNRVVEPPDFYHHSPTIRQLSTVYSKISYLRVYNATLWFHISTWVIIASLFWTEFIPGFGKGITVDKLPAVLWSGFSSCVTSLSSWLLLLCIIIFSQSFAYLLFLIRSPLISIGVTCVAFPLVSIWWSFFEYNHNILIFAPMISGELICGFLGIPLIVGGLYYLFKFDVLKLDFKPSSSSAAPQIV